MSIHEVTLFTASDCIRLHRTASDCTDTASDYIGLHRDCIGPQILTATNSSYGSLLQRSAVAKVRHHKKSMDKDESGFGWRETLVEVQCSPMQLKSLKSDAVSKHSDVVQCSIDAVRCSPMQ